MEEYTINRNPVRIHFEHCTLDEKETYSLYLNLKDLYENKL